MKQLENKEEKLNDYVPPETTMRHLYMEIGKLKSYIQELEDTNAKLIKDFKDYVNPIKQELAELRDYKKTHIGIKYEVVKDWEIQRLKNIFSNRIKNINNRTKELKKSRDKMATLCATYKQMLIDNNISI